MRTNFTEMPGNRLVPGSRESKSFRDWGRGGESESPDHPSQRKPRCLGTPEEEAIEIGNSYRTHY
jgi:hypothetical protein